MQVNEVVKYVRIVRKWWWVVVLLFAVTIGTMLAISLLTETEYEATVTLQISAPPPEEVPLYSQFGREALRDEIEQTRTSFNELLLKGDVAYRTLETLPDIPMEARELREQNMSVDTLQSAQLLQISVRAPDPDTAALLANTLVEVGLQRYGELRAQPTANTRKFIEQQLENAQVELSNAEVELTQFQIANKVGTLDKAMDNQYTLIRSLRMQSDLARAKGDLTEVRALEELILQREAELQNLIGLSAEYNQLVDNVERVRSTYNFLFDRLREAEIKENQILEVNFIQIITPARAPNQPVIALSPKLVVFAAISSLLTGVLLTFLLEYLELLGAFQGLRRFAEQMETVPLSESTS